MEAIFNSLPRKYQLGRNIPRTTIEIMAVCSHSGSWLRCQLTRIACWFTTVETTLEASWNLGGIWFVSAARFPDIVTIMCVRSICYEKFVPSKLIPCGPPSSALQFGSFGEYLPRCPVRALCGVRAVWMCSGVQICQGRTVFVAPSDIGFKLWSSPAEWKQFSLASTK